jgi:DNA-binding NarL/FixJ family response regulator
MPHRIFLVEDHPVMQEGYARLLNREPDFELCGQAESGTEALQAIPKADPDLAIVDLSIPGMNGLDLLKQLRVIVPDLPCLVVTAHSEALYAERALRAGARGFLNKDAPPTEVTASPPSPLEVLSDRELEVFEYFGRGYSTTQTAEALFISPKTVETHRANIKRKLGLDRANEVIQRATLWGESLNTPE